MTEGLLQDTLSPAAAYREELLREGLLFATGVDGLYGRSAGFEAVVEGVDALIGRLSADDRAEQMRFPPVMTRQGFEASGYFRNFPHLSATVHCFCGDDAEHQRVLRCAAEGGDWTGAQAASDVVLTPALATPPVPVGTITGSLVPDPRHALVLADRFSPYTALWNLTGQPAMAVPAATTTDGLPLGVQLVGPPAGEAVLLALGMQLEAASPPTRPPPPAPRGT